MRMDGVGMMAISSVQARKAATILAVAASAAAFSVFFCMFKHGPELPSAPQPARMEASAGAPQERKASGIAGGCAEKQWGLLVKCQDDVKALYESMGGLGGLGLGAFAEGYAAYKEGVREGRIRGGKFMLADYTQHSGRNRLYIFDFSENRLIGAIKVSHGAGNGRRGMVDSVSSMDKSYATPSGLMRIRGVGRGRLQGWTLDGLEQGNSNVFKRAIIIHAWYTPSASSPSISRPTAGCLGLNEGDACRLGLPLSGNEREHALQGWKHCGIYVYFPRRCATSLNSSPAKSPHENHD